MIGGGLRISDLILPAVAQKGVGEFMSDHVMCELFGAIRKPRLEHDAPTAVAVGCGTGQPDRPPFTGDKVVQGNSKPDVLKEIKLNSLR